METLTINKNGVTFEVGVDKHRRYWTNVAEGRWEPETFAIFDRFITRETTFLDVGAWEGPTLLYAAQLAKSAFGFEPDPIAFAGLQRNVGANPHIANVRIFNQCIAAKTGDVQFGSRGAGGDTMSSLLFAGKRTSWTVPAIRLDEFIAREKLPPPFFIKIDTEGGEYSIVPSLRRFFRAQRPTIYLSIHSGFFGSVVRGFFGKARAHLALIHALRSFRFLYDTAGNRIRLSDLLVKKEWRRDTSFIATDRQW